MNKRIHILYLLISVLALGTTVPMVAMLGRAGHLLRGTKLRGGQSWRQTRPTRTPRPTRTTSKRFQLQRPCRHFSVLPKRTRPQKPILEKEIFVKNQIHQIHQIPGQKKHKGLANKDSSKDFLSNMVSTYSELNNRSSQGSGNNLLPKFLEKSELDYKNYSKVERDLYNKIYGDSKTKSRDPIDTRSFSKKNRELAKPTDTGYDSTPNREKPVDDDLISNYPGSQRAFAEESVDLMKIVKQGEKRGSYKPIARAFPKGRRRKMQRKINQSTDDRTERADMRNRANQDLFDRVTTGGIGKPVVRAMAQRLSNSSNKLIVKPGKDKNNLVAQMLEIIQGGYQEVEADIITFQKKSEQTTSQLHTDVTHQPKVEHPNVQLSAHMSEYVLPEPQRAEIKNMPPSQTARRKKVNVVKQQLNNVVCPAEQQKNQLMPTSRKLVQQTAHTVQNNSALAAREAQSIEAFAKLVQAISKSDSAKVVMQNLGTLRKQGFNVVVVDRDFAKQVPELEVVFGKNQTGLSIIRDTKTNEMKFATLATKHGSLCLLKNINAQGNNTKQLLGDGAIASNALVPTGGRKPQEQRPIIVFATKDGALYKMFGNNQNNPLAQVFKFVRKDPKVFAQQFSNHLHGAQRKALPGKTQSTQPQRTEIKNMPQPQTTTIIVQNPLVQKGLDEQPTLQQSIGSKVKQPEPKSQKAKKVKQLVRAQELNGGNGGNDTNKFRPANGGPKKDNKLQPVSHRNKEQVEKQNKDVPKIVKQRVCRDENSKPCYKKNNPKTKKSDGKEQLASRSSRSQGKKPGQALRLPPKLPPYPRIRFKDRKESEPEETEEAENSRGGQHQRVGLDLNPNWRRSVGPDWPNRKNHSDLSVDNPVIPHNKENSKLANKAAAMDNIGNEQPDGKASDTSAMRKSAKGCQKNAHKPEPVRVYQSSGDGKKSDPMDKVVGVFGDDGDNFCNGCTGRAGGFGTEDSSEKPAEGRNESPMSWLWLLLATVAEALSRRKKFLMG